MNTRTFLEQVAYFAKLRRSIWADPAQLKRSRDAKVCRLVSAAATTGYYGELFNRAGISVRDIRSADDLARIPVTSKSDLQNRPIESFLAPGATNDLVTVRTSGSTGTPLRVLKTPSERMFDLQRTVRFYMESGYSLFSPIVGIWRSEPFMEHPFLFQRAGLLRRTIIPVETPLPDQIAALQRLRPGLLFSTVSMLRALAREIAVKRRGIPTPRVVVAIGEHLDAAARRKMAEAFGVEPVANWGASEVGGAIAWECEERSGYHVYADNYIVDLERDGRPVADGEEGKTVVTNLDTLSMPILRYDLGDTAAMTNDRCPCGRHSPRMLNITGRANDVVVLPDGTTRNSQFFTRFFVDVPGLRQYRIIQDDLHRIRILFDAPENAFAALSARFSSDVARFFPPGVDVRLERVDRLPLDPSGKLRVIISSVDSNGAGS